MERLTKDRTAMSPNWAADERQRLGAILSDELAALGEQEVEFRKEKGGGGTQKIRRSQTAQREVARLIDALTRDNPATLEASRQQFSAFLA